jgi:Holliday junction resolvase RusA-like endonuclease
MARIRIKPLSVNQCWQGRRFKTSLYEAYEEELLYLLPPKVIPPGKIYLYLKVGFSSKTADLDNIIKPVLDILQKKYFFDDKRVYRIEASKEIVKKDSEYLDINLEVV